jgi:hypothetical protein
MAWLLFSGNPELRNGSVPQISSDAKAWASRFGELDLLSNQEWLVQI